MAPEDYWKEKRIDKRQVLLAWAIVMMLVVGAHYSEKVYRVVADSAGASEATQADNDGARQVTLATHQDFRPAP